MLMSVRLSSGAVRNALTVAELPAYLRLRSTRQVVTPSDLSPHVSQNVQQEKMQDYSSIRHVAADRKFYDITSSYKQQLCIGYGTVRDANDFLQYIYRNIVGQPTSFAGPYGHRQVVYCDYMASGKALQFIEDFIHKEVLPMYGNTHTTTSVTSLQTTLFRHEARDIIRNAVNASEHDSVIFVGTGCTGAVHKLISALNLQKSPVVFVGPFEHHSNLLPWRELGAQIVRIKETKDGLLDVYHLETELQKYQNLGKMMIGTFSVASNITGILTDDIEVSALLHKYNALAFWDYAAAAPYVEVNMNPIITGPHQGLVYKDAIFLSPHKFIGGPDTPGILIAKKKLFNNPTPSGGGGGGSVFFVTRESHRYLQEIEMREEGGTPSIIGSIRAGMVFQLKEAITSKVIMEKEHYFCRKATSVWKEIPQLIILGNPKAPRLPVFSFIIIHPESGLILHHNFVSAVLNDLFGIQSRGGCACAGPYAQDLLGIDETLALHIEDLLAEDRTLDRVHLRRYLEYSEREVLRPGFTRLNFPFFIPDDEADFIIEAVSIIAREGWKLLPQYIFNPETGEWKHQNQQVFKDRKWLGSISYESGRFAFVQPKEVLTDLLPTSFSECLQKAKEILAVTKKTAQRYHLADQEVMFDDDAAKLRWFLLPSEAKSFLLEDIRQTKKNIPFCPPNHFTVENNNDIKSNWELKGLPFTYYDNEKDISISKEYTLNLRKNEKLQSQTNIIDIANDDCFPKTNENKEPNKGNETEKCVLNNTCCRNRITKLEKYPKIKTKHLWHSPPKSIFKPFLKAILEFNMIQSDDKILVCLSGGKDSLSLLHTLHQYQFYSKQKGVNFELGAVTIDPGSSAYDPSPLKSYLASLEVPYYYEQQAIMKQAISMEECTSICSFCSRMKRGRIYATARRNGYNVIALGQHLDDLAESFFMSVFHNGRLRTMKAHYTNKEKDIRIIRPFVYVREKYLRKFAEERKLPVIAENCPACFEAPKERHRMKQLLAAQEILFPRLYLNLKSSLHPLMSIRQTGIESNKLFWYGEKENDISSDSE